MQAPNRPTRRRRRIVESDDSEEEVTYEVAPTVAPPPQKKSRAQKPRPPQRPAKRPCAEARPVLRENARLTQPSQKQPRRRGAAPTPRPPTPEWDVNPEDEDEIQREREVEAAAAFEASQAKARTATSGSTGGATRAPPRSGSTGGTTRAPPAPPPVPCQLTADQRAVAAWRPPAWAADRRGKLVRVVAHAGTGKTTTLAALAANLAASARTGVHIHRRAARAVTRRRRVTGAFSRRRNRRRASSPGSSSATGPSTARPPPTPRKDLEGVPLDTASTRGRSTPRYWLSSKTVWKSTSELRRWRGAPEI